MDWNAIVGAIALVVGIVLGLVGWIVRSVDRRLDAVENKTDENAKQIARLDERTSHIHPSGYRH